MNAIKTTCVALGSALIGGVIGYFVARQMYANEYEMHCFEYEESLKKNINRIKPKQEIASHADDNSSGDAVILTKDGRVWGEDKPDLRELAKRYNDKDLNQFVAERESPPEDDEETEEDESDDGDEDDDYIDPIADIPRDVPYVIKIDEYENTRLHYDKISLTYFMGDCTLVEDDHLDETIEDPEKMLGPDALTMFGWDEDPNVVCVRNDRLAADFYIEQIPGNYSDF